MRVKILITGSPRCGKSTLISKLIEKFSIIKTPIRGFLSPEVKKGNKRIGFDIEDISTNKRQKLARTGNYNTKYKLGKYSVFIEDFENYVLKLENIEFQEDFLIIIDEIGKMELFSSKFQDFIKDLFSSDLSIIATIGLTVKHPIKNFILKSSNVKLFHLTRQNSQRVYNDIISIIL
ncbi:MAG: nucleoside-triphosphatase [Promethearchaeota archaeon]|jgi:nucleoside-triphosphatase